MINAVIFDLDDTLILERDYIKSGYEAVAKKIYTDFGVDEMRLVKLFNSMFKISANNVFNRALDTLQIKYGEDYIRKLIYEYRNHWPKLQLTKDSVNLIKYLKEKEYKLGIIADGYKETQQKKLEVLNVKQLFHHIILTDELGREYWKPHEKSYLLMKDKLKVEFNEMVYIGDNVQKDFITAKKLGIKTIQVKRENCIYGNVIGSEEYLPDIVISDLCEVITYMQEGYRM